jgi:hypothetical protein
MKSMKTKNILMAFIISAGLLVSSKPSAGKTWEQNLEESFNKYLSQYKTQLLKVDIKQDIYTQLWELRAYLISKDRKKALNLLKKILQEVLKLGPKKWIVVKASLFDLNNVQDLKEITEKLFSAKVFCENYQLRKAEAILRSLRSELELTQLVISKNLLINSLALLSEILKPQKVSYTAGISTLDALLSEFREIHKIIPIPLLKIKFLISTEKKTLSEEFFKILWENLLIAHYLGYIDGEMFNELKTLYEKILKAWKDKKDYRTPLKEFKFLIDQQF